MNTHIFPEKTNEEKEKANDKINILKVHLLCKCPANHFPLYNSKTVQFEFDCEYLQETKIINNYE